MIGHSDPVSSYESTRLVIETARPESRHRKRQHLLEAFLNKLQPTPAPAHRRSPPENSSMALERIRQAMGSDPAKPETLPFYGNDATAGTENELQVAVVGQPGAVDLPRTIRESDFYQNIVRQAASGDTSPRRVAALEAYLEGTRDRVWENSWVKFPRSCLTAYANQVLDQDLRADKKRSTSPRRKDAHRFLKVEAGEEQLRVPVSYLLKLALADAVSGPAVPPLVRSVGVRFLSHFLNDNTSPETLSFYPAPLAPESGGGRAIAAETAKRYLLCQFLVQYANRHFNLTAMGQHAVIYFAPNPPLRQKRLNELIPDTFYRDLYMSPCLSGWDDGMAKHRYMGLCHKVLSRSQLNAVAKLKEAGIVTSNLVVLPNMSNISLANNGTHLSLGSRRLTRALSAGAPGFGPAQEKYLGDLVIKISEHFLPLFVGSYSGAPYRLDFWDFHPEKALGFLPHELNFTHLRMIWRRWKKKADLNFFGRALTPFGPEWLDRTLSRLLRLRGDFVPDFRLIDYLVCLMSTEKHPGLDGASGNDLRLRDSLCAMGVFDGAMALYLLYRLRSHATMGFSGFEGRHYSQFHSLLGDLGPAADLQRLVTALAYRYALEGAVTHDCIPDTTAVESERRQIFFGTAIGIPTFFIHAKTRNRFMQRILSKTEKTRPSRRYTGYLRVHNIAYRQALVGLIRQDAPELVEALGLDHAMGDLARRIEAPRSASAAGRLTAGILDQAGARKPMALSGQDFNAAAETYYRETLRRQQTAEAYDLLCGDAKALDAWSSWRSGIYNRSLMDLFSGRRVEDILAAMRRDVLDENAGADTLRKLIHLTILTFHQDMVSADHASPTP